MKKFFAIAVLIVATASPERAQAGLLVESDFTGEPGNQAATSASFAVSGVQAEPVTRGPGLTANLGVNSINSRAWTFGATPDPNDYYQFIVGPQSSSVPLALSQLEYTAQRSATGPTGFELQASSVREFGS